MGQRREPRRGVTFMYACWGAGHAGRRGLRDRDVGLAADGRCLLFNALETAGTIVWATIKQRHVPASLLGRVSSLDWVISIGLLPLSFALTAPVAAAVGAQATLVGAAVIGGAITLGALFLPGMRDLERAVEEDAAEAASPEAVSPGGCVERARRIRGLRL